MEMGEVTESTNKDDGLDMELDLGALDELDGLDNVESPKQESENTNEADSEDVANIEDIELSPTQEQSPELQDNTNTESSIDKDVDLEDIGDLDALGDQATQDDLQPQAQANETSESEATQASSNPVLDEINLEETQVDSKDEISQDVNDIDSMEMGEIPISEDFSKDGLLESDLLDIDDTDKTEGKPVLDSEQVNEVSLALNALSEDTKVEEDDFASLKEPDVARALGEDIGIDDDLGEADSTPQEIQQVKDSVPQDTNAQAQDFVKDVISSSLQSSIANLSSDSLKSVLDGLEVTINISFKDKSK